MQKARKILINSSKLSNNWTKKKLQSILSSVFIPSKNSNGSDGGGYGGDGAVAAVRNKRCQRGCRRGEAVGRGRLAGERNWDGYGGAPCGEIRVQRPHTLLLDC